MIEKAVKALLDEKGWTQGDLAKRMNVKPETVSRQLRGNPTLETVKKIAKELNVHVLQLFTYEDDPNSVYGYIEYLGRVYKVASKKDLEDIIKLMD